MFRLYSKGCEYAIRALMYAVQDGAANRFSAAEVCRKADIPEYFTRKIFQALVQGGFLEASRGPGGGYVLTRPPEQISMLDVIHAVDGEETFDHCIMGLRECSDAGGCPMHPLWSEAKQSMLKQLAETTLQDVVNIAFPPEGARPEPTQCAHKPDSGNASARGRRKDQ